MKEKYYNIINRTKKKDSFLRRALTSDFNHKILNKKYTTQSEFEKAKRKPNFYWRKEMRKN